LNHTFRLEYLLTKTEILTTITGKMPRRLPQLSNKNFALLLSTTFALFGFLTYKVLDKDTIIFDTKFNELIQSTRTPATNYWMNIVTDMGQIGGLMFAVVLSVYLGYKNKINTAFNLLGCVFGAVFLTEFLKLVFNRDRPDILNRLTSEFTLSFPSGHATASFVLFPILAVLFYDQTDVSTNYKRLVVFVLSIFPFVVGYSRLYLGVHYATDILGGSIVGLTFASIFYYNYTKAKR
jgi:undecaprenyl-diphosphatase